MQRHACLFIDVVMQVSVPEQSGISINRWKENNKSSVSVAVGTILLTKTIEGLQRRRPSSVPYSKPHLGKQNSQDVTSQCLITVSIHSFAFNSF